MGAVGSLGFMLWVGRQNHSRLLTRFSRSECSPRSSPWRGPGRLRNGGRVLSEQRSMVQRSRWPPWPSREWLHRSPFRYCSTSLLSADCNRSPDSGAGAKKICAKSVRDFLARLRVLNVCNWIRGARSTYTVMMDVQMIGRPALVFMLAWAFFDAEAQTPQLRVSKAPHAQAESRKAASHPAAAPQQRVHPARRRPRPIPVPKVAK
jgi:hypothetical protein